MFPVLLWYLSLISSTTGTGKSKASSCQRIEIQSPLATNSMHESSNSYQMSSSRFTRFLLLINMMTFSSVMLGCMNCSIHISTSSVTLKKSLIHKVHNEFSASIDEGRRSSLTNLRSTLIEKSLAQLGRIILI